MRSIAGTRTRRRWSRVSDGSVRSQRVAAEANALGAEAWWVALHHPAAAPGTYRASIGYGGIGLLASPDWDIAAPLAPIADMRGPSFAQRLHTDAQPDGSALWVYIPKGVTSLDFEMLANEVVFAKTLTLYRGLPLGGHAEARGRHHGAGNAACAARAGRDGRARALRPGRLVDGRAALPLDPAPVGALAFGAAGATRHRGRGWARAATMTADAPQP